MKSVKAAAQRRWRGLSRRPGSPAVRAGTGGAGRSPDGEQARDHRRHGRAGTAAGTGRAGTVVGRGQAAHRRTGAGAGASPAGDTRGPSPREGRRGTVAGIARPSPEWSRRGPSPGRSARSASGVLAEAARAWLRRRACDLLSQQGPDRHPPGRVRGPAVPRSSPRVCFEVPARPGSGSSALGWQAEERIAELCTTTATPQAGMRGSLSRARLRHDASRQGLRNTP
jgi:hypothetical protein